jgi:hypothetical protein
MSRFAPYTPTAKAGALRPVSVNPAAYSPYNNQLGMEHGTAGSRTKSISNVSACRGWLKVVSSTCNLGDFFLLWVLAMFGTGANHEHCV